MKIIVRFRKKFICIVLVVFLLMLLSASLHADEIKKYEDKAWSYLQEENTELAIQAAKKAIALDQNSALGNIVLSRAYYSWALYDDSITHAKRAIMVVPDFWVPYYFLGLSYKGKGMYNEAIDKFDEAIKLDPASAASVYGEMGNTMSLMGQHDKAILMLKKSIELSGEGQKDSIIHAYLGDVYKKTNLDDLAIAEYEESLIINPKNLSSYFSLLQLYSKKRQEEKGRQVLEKLNHLFRDKNFQLEPFMVIGVNKPDLRDNIAQIQNLVLKTDKSMTKEQYVNYKNYLITLFYFLCNAEIVGKYPSLRKLERGDVSDATKGLFNKALSLQKKEAWEEAEELYVNAIKIYPAGENLHRNLATLYLDTGRNEEAIIEYKTAIAINPTIVEYYYSLGYVYMATDRYEDALPYLRQACIIDPNHADAVRALKHVNYRTGR